jgi:hypothetical protein
MRDEITLAEITAELLEKAQNLFAEDPAGNRKLIWESKKMPAFGHSSVTVPVGYFPFIMVPTLEAPDLAPVFANLCEADPFGSRRLIGC